MTRLLFLIAIGSILMVQSAESQILKRKVFYSSNYAGRLAILPSASTDDEARNGNGDARLLQDHSCVRLQWNRLAEPHDLWFMLNHLVPNQPSERVFIAIQIAHISEQDDAGTSLSRNPGWFEKNRKLPDIDWVSRGYIPDLRPDEFWELHRRDTGNDDLKKKMAPPTEWHASPDQNARSTWEDHDFWANSAAFQTLGNSRITYFNNMLIGFRERFMGDNGKGSVDDSDPADRVVFRVRSDRARSLIVRTFSGRGNPAYLRGEYEVALYGRCYKF